MEGDAKKFITKLIYEAFPEVRRALDLSTRARR